MMREHFAIYVNFMQAGHAYDFGRSQVDGFGNPRSLDMSSEAAMCDARMKSVRQIRRRPNI